MEFVRNKKIVLALVLALVAGLAGFWIYAIFYSKNDSETAEIVSLETKKPIKESPDSDNDGLKDWEEVLWGTDPQDPDTDGDKTADSEEVKLGRDPKKAGPSDFLTDAAKSEIEGKISQAEESSLKASNLTQKVAQDVFLAYNESKLQGSGISQVTEQIPDFLSNNLSEAGLLQNQFSSKDIKIVASGEGAVKSYINALAKLSREAGAKITQNELITLTNLINKSNASDDFKNFSEFEGNAQIYKELVSKMLSLEVPQDYASVHLEYLNAFANLEKINLIFSRFMGDPVSGLLAVNQYIKETDRITSALLTMGLKIQKDGVTFGIEEEGFALTSLISQL